MMIELAFRIPDFDDWVISPVGLICEIIVLAITTAIVYSDRRPASVPSQARTGTRLAQVVTILVRTLSVGMTAILAACDAPVAPVVAKEEIPVYGIAPPKPPDCPDLPELANLRLKDGQIADVRIFRDGDETFYVPFSWLSWEAERGRDYGHQGKHGVYFIHGFWEEMKTRRLDYQVHEIECPGVVHTGEFTYKTPHSLDGGTPPRYLDRGTHAPPNFTKWFGEKTIFIARFDSDHPWFSKPDRFEDIFDGPGSRPTGAIRVNSIRWITFEYNLYEAFLSSGRSTGHPDWAPFKAGVLASDNWKLTKKAVLEFLAWLETPPKDRDNDRLFFEDNRIFNLIDRKGRYQ
jgi:hypothetical protein